MFKIIILFTKQLDRYRKQSVKLYLGLHGVTCVTFFILYAIKSSIIVQIVSLIIYVMTHFNFSLQLFERHFIGLSKYLNFILISGIICQELGVTRSHLCKM